MYFVHSTIVYVLSNPLCYIYVSTEYSDQRVTYPDMGGRLIKFSLVKLIHLLQAEVTQAGYKGARHSCFRPILCVDSVSVSQKEVIMCVTASLGG